MADDCLVCTLDWEYREKTCSHTDADRITYVLRILWNTLVPNTQATDPRNTFPSMHVDEVRALSRDDADLLQRERDELIERRGFKRGLAYAIQYLDWPTWKDATSEAEIVVETYRHWAAHLKDELYDIKGWPMLPREIEWEREETQEQ
jgi:hypothetical protein